MAAYGEGVVPDYTQRYKHFAPTAEANEQIHDLRRKSLKRWKIDTRIDDKHDVWHDLGDGGRSRRVLPGSE